MYCNASSLPYHQTLVHTWTTPAPSLHRSQYDKPLEVHITGTPPHPTAFSPTMPCDMLQPRAKNKRHTHTHTHTCLKEVPRTACASTIMPFHSHHQCSFTQTTIENTHIQRHPASSSAGPSAVLHPQAARRGAL